MEDDKAKPPVTAKPLSEFESQVHSEAESPTTDPPAIQLRPAARELLGFTLAIATAGGSRAATNVDVVLASLARLARTALDKVELERAATSALVRILPEPSAGRIAAALSAVGVDPSKLVSDAGANPGDPRLALVVKDGYALAHRLGGKEVWSHYLVGAALAQDLPDGVLAALGVSLDQLRAALRSAIAERWNDESSAIWDSVLRVRVDDTAVKWADDAPARKDLLKREDLAGVLAARLRQVLESSGASFLVHIDGGWGAGKSSLLNFLDSKLSIRPPESTLDSDEPESQLSVPHLESTRRYDEFLVVRFNAWQQSRIGPPWWTLLTAARQAIASRRGWRGRRWLRIRETYARIRRTGAPYLLALLILIVTITVIAYALWPHQSTTESWSKIAQAVTAIAAAMAVIWTGSRVATRFLLWDSPGGARLFEKSGGSPLREITNQFGWLIDRSPDPVVFFIDDLDRCNSDYVVNFLDTIQTIVRDAAEPEYKQGRAARPENAQDRARRNQVMFVVAADGAWLRTSYEGAYQDFSKAVAKPGRPLGYLFLDKIFQLTMPVPTASKSAQQAFLDGLLLVPSADSMPDTQQITVAKEDLKNARGDGEQIRNVMQGLPKQVKDAVSGDAARALADPETRNHTEHKLRKFTSLLDGNPRTTKRFLNTFTIIEAIRTIETAEVVPFDTLALWSIIRVRWPEIADYLEKNPAAIANILDEPTSTGLSEDLRFAMSLPDLRKVVLHSQGGPLDEQLVRLCSGNAEQ